MKKWQGFILTEHNEQLTSNKNQSNRMNEAKEQLSEEMIGQLLQRAYQQHRMIAIQKNEQRNGLYLDDLVGYVQGFQDEFIYIVNELKEVSTLQLEEIRNIEEVSTLKWFDL